MISSSFTGKIGESTILRPQSHDFDNASRVRRLVHVAEFDGVRGIAALLVFFHHLCFTSIKTQEWGAGINLLANIFKYGNTGVDLFFVLSGFLISSLLIEDRESPRYYQDFYWKRALRILPLYVVCLLGVLIFYPGSTGYVVLSTVFIANFAQIFHITSSGPFWTLAIEEQFYLLWPSVVRRRSIQTISRCAVSVGLAAVVLRIVAASFGHHNYAFTFLRCDGLAMGAWLACRFERPQRLDATTSREKMAWAGSLLLATGLLVLPRVLPDGPRGEAFGAAGLQTAVTLLAGALISLLLAHRGRPYLAFFRSRFLRFFGLISYAMYMIHLYVLYIYDHFVGALPPANVEAYTLRLFSVLGVTIAVCLMSRYLLELPASSLRRYVLRSAAPIMTSSPSTAGPLQPADTH